MDMMRRDLVRGIGKSRSCVWWMRGGSCAGTFRGWCAARVDQGDHGRLGLPCGKNPQEFDHHSAPHRWLIDAAIVESTMMILAAFWFWVFVPHQSKRIYVVDIHALGIERSGKTLESVPRHEIESVTDLGAAIKITRSNARPILLYAGEQKNALLEALR